MIDRRNDILFKEVIICCNNFFLIEMIINLNMLILFWGKLDFVLKEAITIAT